ncbi:glycosyltransferase [Mongoliitalea daihaiensis]|uniref:glycosyltransferase n=1 Tax=Mongoliitalea daihaiensis TaxID=2782006 RepID=UPI001F43ACCE|nr:glycosyltransferase [Mongoliitalea daihaiensis]UJP64164.1 glycosyltransferase [Mongoliitalea daihaiensis]
MNKRVLFLIDTLQTGGAEKSLLEITSRFQNFKPIFLTIYQGDHALEATYQQVGLEVLHLNFPKGMDYKEILPNLRAFVSALQPALIHASLFHSEMLSRKLNLDIPIINSLVNNSYHPRRYQTLTWKGKLALLRVYLLDRITKNKVDLFIANSTYMAKVHQKSLKIAPDKLKVIHRGRDSKIFENPDHKKLKQIRNQVPNPETKIFLNIGRLIARKGQEELILAFDQLLKSQNNFSQTYNLWFVGKGDQQDHLQNLAQSLKLQDQVIFLGDRKDIPELLAAADYFVFPSHYEGLPGALIEAMMAKVPIIASDIPENKECLSSDMALFHQVRNPNDLAKQLQAALTAQDWPKRTSLAHAFACEHFDIEKIAQSYEETYAQLIRG